MTLRNRIVSIILLGVLALTTSKLKWNAELRERARSVREPGPAPIAAFSPAVEGTRKPRATSESAVVARVFDGDSVQLESGHGLRYIGIDAPEIPHGHRTAECLAADATTRNRVLVAGKAVRLERDASNTDRYGRLLRYVYVGDTFVNEALVREGYARARAYPPDTRHQNTLHTAEADARAARRGLWGTACSS